MCVNLAHVAEIVDGIVVAAAGGANEGYQGEEFIQAISHGDQRERC
jgi:hypothetical protein